MTRWTTIHAPADAAAPAPLAVRAQTIPPHGRFPRHTHDWGQLVYAIDGALSVTLDAQSFVISPEQAAWLPSGVAHQVGSWPGAAFRSLWIADDVAGAMPPRPIVFQVTALLRALIVEAAALGRDAAATPYGARVTRLILDQLERARPLERSLPWPTSAPLTRMCEAIHDDPADPRTAADWQAMLAMSARTLSRRFEAETGMSLRSWRRRVRLFRAVELLGARADVTQAALALGYGSTSAFIYAFRREFGLSPLAFMRSRNAPPPPPPR
ncbi:AraC family transcriptional regulator [Sphingomonas colocasiae]|uniref:Helix-turn-helix transcriptional regulator n=1 Tax=Sphingomonas colocasiae TaxID=1848973 RepID=A0ABS7PWN6_9SPHN|nr:helix-turn-helix transcriptional regulator [Sphingomonas colocasiae]MBY8825060.1 helix-turn-helix transcriptional regulator [Sphingomonas colocasiae]